MDAREYRRVGYDSHPSTLVCKFDFLTILCGIIAILDSFHAFFTRLEALGTQGSTGGMGLTAIPPNWYVFVGEHLN